MNETESAGGGWANWLGDVAGSAWTWLTAETPWARAGDAWAWWQGLFDSYAWREIGAFVVPALIVVAIVMFRGISRMHLRG